MTTKELLKTYLVKEVDVNTPSYQVEEYGENGITSKYSVNGFTNSRVKQLDLDKLIDLLSRVIKTSDIIEE